MFKSTIPQIRLPDGFRAQTEQRADGSLNIKFSPSVELPVRKTEDKVLVPAFYALLIETLPSIVEPDGYYEPLKFTLSPKDIFARRIFFLEPNGGKGANKPTLEIIASAASPSYFTKSSSGPRIEEVSIYGFVPICLETLYDELKKAASDDRFQINRDLTYRIARAILYDKEFTFGEDEVVANWGTRPYLPIYNPTQQRMSGARENAWKIEAFFLQNIGTLLDIAEYFANARSLYREYTKKVEEARKLSDRLAAVGEELTGIDGKLRLGFQKPRWLNYFPDLINAAVSRELEPVQSKLRALKAAFPRKLMEYVSPTFYPRSF